MAANSLRKENTEQLKTKNRKLDKLISISHLKPNKNTYSIPIKNLSSTDVDVSALKKKGMNFSFVDKNKFVKQNLAVEMESLAFLLEKSVSNGSKEEFHEFLRGKVNKFTQNIYHSNDDTYKSLRSLINNDTIVFLSGDKDSSIVVMDKCDYVTKVNSLMKV